MQKQRIYSLSAVAAIGLISSLGLNSCNDDGSPRTPETAKAPEIQPALPEAPAATASPEESALLDYMLYNVGNMVGKQAANPLWRDSVRDMRNQVESYYNSLKANQGNSIKTVRLGQLYADITLNLAAFDKAIDIYNSVLKDWEELPESDRTGIEGRRIRSAIANGTGSALLSRRRATEALPYYEKALEIDTEIFNELLPPDSNGVLPPGDGASKDLERAAEDLVSSYRCLGECQFIADDPEEARDTYKKGQELVTRMNNLRPSVTLQFIRLLSSMGNLESNVGETKRAFAAWSSAANLAQRLLRTAPSASVQAQVRNFLRELEPSIKSVGQKLKEASAAEQAQ